MAVIAYADKTIAAKYLLKNLNAYTKTLINGIIHQRSDTMRPVVENLQRTQPVAGDGIHKRGYFVATLTQRTDTYHLIIDRA